ncbi:LEA type 2 family protein [Ferroglobus sp.]|uniref:LEA type 2 family protein n=1 Tax=Ferroglobus sp. TaxID=2614230 RepID=UPI0025BD9AF5|nr:LEA type 2 family protein [Ferroglobus sp.]
MQWRSVVLIILIATLIPLCSQKPKFEKPTVTIDDIKFQNATTEQVTFSVRVIVDNPNPFGVKLTKVSFDLYYKEGDSYKFLGKGEEKNIEIRKSGTTTVEIPVSIENKRLIETLIKLAREGSVELKASGSAYIDVKVTTIEVPFEKIKVLQAEELKGLTITVPTQTQSGEAEIIEYNETEITPTPSLTPIPTPTPTPTATPKPKLLVTVKPSPAKVRQTVTIKVTDENGNPVEGAWVGYVEVGKAVVTGDVISNLNYIGKTDANGIVTHKFTVPDLYYIGAKKIGYQFGYTQLRVKILS